MIKDALYVDPLIWLLYGFLLSSLITVAVYILTKEYFYRKGLEEGLKEKKVEFKKVGKPRGKTDDPDGIKEVVQRFAQNATVTKSKPKKGLK